MSDKKRKECLGLQMEYLYNKFIKRGSLYTLNLPGGLTETLWRFFEKDKSHQNQPKESFLFNVLDDCAYIILDLMLDSFRRFAATETYKKLELELDAQRRKSRTATATKSWMSTPTSNTGGNGGGITPFADPGMLRHAASFNELQSQYELRNSK